MYRYGFTVKVCGEKFVHSSLYVVSLVWLIQVWCNTWAIPCWRISFSLCSLFKIAQVENFAPFQIEKKKTKYLARVLLPWLGCTGVVVKSRREEGKQVSQTLENYPTSSGNVVLIFNILFSVSVSVPHNEHGCAHLITRETSGLTSTGALKGCSCSA